MQLVLAPGASVVTEQLGPVASEPAGDVWVSLTLRPVTVPLVLLVTAKT